VKRKSGFLVTKTLNFDFFKKDRKLTVLCLGAHPDDIEIGAGGTILKLVEEMPETEFHWIVLSGQGERNREAHRSASLFLVNSKTKRVEVQDFRESYFPFIGREIKDYFEKLKNDVSPDLILTHHRDDAHQDHRLTASLTWNTFRDHLICEYEIPKYDGDLGHPNVYVTLNESQVERKIKIIADSFQTQRKRQWFTEDTFRSIMRIRGLESNSTSRSAEAFFCRKIIL
jgi:LmbE family N-acetylglucosaminyl deacetylase